MSTRWEEKLIDAVKSRLMGGYKSARIFFDNINSVIGTAVQKFCGEKSKRYPLYQKGNPQRRVFLPNFWMKLVKPEFKQPENIVQFHCSMQMTRYDVQSYLEKIYKVNPIHVRTRIALGKTKRSLGLKGIVKEEDVKIAYVVLPKDEKFIFPDLFKDVEDDEDKYKDEMERTVSDFNKSSKLPGAPSWFITH